MIKDSDRKAGGLFASATLLDPPSVICRFSCGAASAVATKLAIAKYGTVEIYYNDPGSEHATISASSMSVRNGSGKR